MDGERLHARRRRVAAHRRHPRRALRSPPDAHGRRADRPGAPSPCKAASRREPGNGAAAGRAGARLGERGPVRRRLRPRTGERPRVGVGHGHGLVDRRGRAARGVRVVGAPHPCADAADDPVPLTQVQQRQRGELLPLLRHVRLGLPLGPIPPDGPALLAVTGGPSHPPVDRDAHRGGTHRGGPVGPRRWAAGRADRTRAPVHRPRLGWRWSFA